MKFALFPFSLILLVNLSSCNTFEHQGNATAKADQVLFTINTDKPRYFSNEEITVAIRNNHDATIEYYGMCSLTLCQFTNGEWMCAMKDCDAPKIILRSGDSMEFKEIAASFTAGKFRYQLEYFVASSDSLLVAYSNEFTINP